MKYFNQSKPFRLLSSAAYILCVPFGKLVNLLFFNISIDGKKHLKQYRRQGAITVSNHTLYCDPLVLSDAIFPRRALFTTLSSNLSLPVVGQYIKLLGAMPIPAKQDVSDLKRALGEAVGAGWFVHFFPERNLSHYNQKINRFHNGAFHFSIDFNVPVIPIATVVHRRKFFGRELPKWLPPRVKMKVLEPIHPDEFREGHTPLQQVRCLSKACYRRLQTAIDEAHSV